MEKALTLIPVGNETGMILPTEVFSALDVAEGGEIMLVETPGGFFLRSAKS